MLVAVIGLVAAACTDDRQSGDPAPAPERTGGTGTTMVVSAVVHTVDPDQPSAEAFAYDDEGTIVAVGDEAEVRDAAGDEPTVIDAGGATVLPGFQDAHVHVPEAGINETTCVMEGSDLADLEAQAEDCAAQQPDADWVRAAGASLFDLRGAAENPIDVLDRAVPDRPALILDDLGHAVWTNSLGLAEAGIGADDPDPQGGVLYRDPETGRLTGLLLEDAQQLVRNAAALDDEANYQGLLVALDELAKNGVTSVSDAGGYWMQNHPAAWERAEAEGTLTVRGMNSLYVYPDLPMDEQLAEFKRRFSDDSDLLRFDTAKIYIDGILDLGTASMLEPYDEPVDPNYPSGFNYFPPDELRTYVNELYAMGYRTNFHVIGDRAVRDALDAVEAIDDDPEAIAGRHHRTTHTYLVDPADLGRFAELGMIADQQQSQNAVETDYHDFLAGFIGDRADDLIPTEQLLDAGATVTLSSDWDAGPLPPLGTIERSLTRDANAVPDLETAIRMHTLDAAVALGHDDTTGSIEVGKFADYVVLDADPFEVEPDDLDETEVLMTVVGGDAVYAAPGFPS